MKVAMNVTTTMHSNIVNDIKTAKTLEYRTSGYWL